jgi:hypothetical protein
MEKRSKRITLKLSEVLEIYTDFFFLSFCLRGGWFGNRCPFFHQSKKTQHEKREIPSQKEQKGTSLSGENNRNSGKKALPLHTGERKKGKGSFYSSRLLVCICQHSSDRKAFLTTLVGRVDN